MALPTKHLRLQGPVIASLGATAFEALRRRVTGKLPTMPDSLPAPAVSATVAPRPRDLVRDYVRFCGGDPSSYRHTVPPHLWPQWGLPLAARVLEDLPYPIFKVLNGGCRVEVNAPIAVDEPLQVSAQLMSIDENERRAVLETRVITNTAAAPEAVVATMYAVVPLAKASRGDRSKQGKTHQGVPVQADELARWRIPERAGLTFAMLTGDFNPLHWVPSYARAFGFRNTILHGFATLGKAWEGLLRSRFAGAPTAIRVVDAKFSKPLILPAKVGLYLEAGADAPDRFWVAAGPGASPYLRGTVDGARAN